MGFYNPYEISCLDNLFVIDLRRLTQVGFHLSQFQSFSSKRGGCDKGFNLESTRKKTILQDVLIVSSANKLALLQISPGAMQDLVIFKFKGLKGITIKNCVTNLREITLL